ncbi:hypothetical protein OG976_22920 [Mycobacterium sp. NBC_00419]|uniref:hypothetical protein n=1 Tax=Mycobacterium sp. NBC_00419 TaxID=2975989 RepID=UPI002E1B7FDF
MPSSDVAEMLRGIERQVLDDVWIDPRRRVFTAVVIAWLAAAAALGWADVHDRAATGTPGIAGCAVSLSLFTATAMVSSIALLRSTFRWCTLGAGGVVASDHPDRPGSGAAPVDGGRSAVFSGTGAGVAAGGPDPAGTLPA